MRLIAFLNKLYIFFELVEIFFTGKRTGRLPEPLLCKEPLHRPVRRKRGSRRGHAKIKTKDLYDTLEQAQTLIVVCHNIQYILTVLQWERFSQK